MMRTRICAMLALWWFSTGVAHAQLQFSSIDDAPSNEYYETSRWRVRGPNGLRYQYCLHRPRDGQNNNTVLLFLHGALDDETAWTRSIFDRTQTRLETVQRILHAESRLPTVITVSFADIFVLTPSEPETGNPLGRTLWPNSATLENYMDAVNAIETREGISGKRRWLMGLSQGGLSALELLLLYGNSTIDRQPTSDPSQRFVERIVALNAMIPFCEPFAPGLPTECWVLFNAQGGPGLLVTLNFRNEEHWNPADPAGRLGQERLRSNLPPFQVQYAVDDEWRLDVKNEVFASDAVVKGAPIDWIANPGNHTDFCPEAAADFLLGNRDNLLGAGIQTCVSLRDDGDNSDRDDDGVPNSADNCADDYNPDQVDTDGDLIGDACDPFPDDRDNDSIPDLVDNCPDEWNPTQLDDNKNGIGDACESLYDDSDLDGVPDALDNCPETYNTDQTDSDSDGLGNACDPRPFDTDGDSAGDSRHPIPVNGVCGPIGLVGYTLSLTAYAVVLAGRRWRRV